MHLESTKDPRIGYIKRLKKCDEIHPRNTFLTDIMDTKHVNLHHITTFKLMNKLIMVIIFLRLPTMQTEVTMRNRNTSLETLSTYHSENYLIQ